MNKVILLGRLGSEVDLRYTPQGTPVAKFNLAVNEGYGDKQKTTWVTIIAWNKQAENCANYLKKGLRALIEGRLSIRDYETNDGQKRKATEVIANQVQFLDRDRDDATGAGSGSAGAGHDEPSGTNLDDLPF